MRLFQKLLLAFTLAALLVVGVGYLSLNLSRSVERGMIALGRSAVDELDHAGMMALNLLGSQVAIQELMEERYSLQSADSRAERTVLRSKAIQARNRLEEELDDFAEHLQASRAATEQGLDLAVRWNEDDEVENEGEELAWLEELEETFTTYKRLTREFIALTETDFAAADRFLENQLEPFYLKEMLPRIDRYRDDAREEFAEETIEVQEAAQTVGRVIMLTSIGAFSLALMLGFFVSRSIARRLSTLAAAVRDIGSGDFDRRIDDTSADEIGDLGRTFNQMADALAQTVVSKSHVDSIIDSMADMLIVTDSQGKILRVNAAALHMLGYEENEMIGYPVSLLFPDEAADESTFARQIIQQEELVNYQARFKPRQHKAIPVAVSAAQLRDSAGRLEGYVVVAKDVTTTKQFEAELVAAKEAAEAATQAKSEFLANMSHEIRTPMNGVIGMAGLLLNTDLSDEQREFVQTIRVSGDTLLKIINDVLDFSKIEAGMLELEKSAFDVRTTVEDVLDLMAYRAVEKRIELTYKPETVCPMQSLGTQQGCGRCWST